MHMPSVHSKSTVVQTEILPYAVDIQMESPPLVMFGPPDASTGALASGQLKLTVFDESLDIECLELRLIMTASSSRTVSHSCDKCRTYECVIQRWHFIDSPRDVSKGTQLWPFSYLIAGHFPTTTQTPFASIKYRIEVRLVYLSNCSRKKEPVQGVHCFPLRISRAILPDVDKTTHRIFPPTQLTATIVFPNVFYPGAQHTLDLTITGILCPDNMLWRLKKVNWRIDEIYNMISVPCSNHSMRLQNMKDVRKTKNGLHIEEYRTIGAGEIKNGWKSDFQCGTGKTEFELTVSTQMLSGISCDIDTIFANPLESPLMMSVSHSLTIEAIVVEESMRASSASEVRRISGAARILKLTIPIKLTERSGLGVSWDEECPPMFDFVGDPPPCYEAATKKDKMQKTTKREIVHLQGIDQTL